jgi:D-beta-D-heptose 7-phosphate kinase/D-beta-D-heptose 1-phosphate adenosyltransferase
MLSIKYHNIFDYELVKSDFPKWKHKGDKSITGITSIKSKQRLQREKISEKKIVIAKKAAKIISQIPTVKFVGITGALAMMNAKEDSDIDLMIITSSNSLWTTRAFAYLLICLFGIQRRYPNDKIQKNRLCINMWLDETDLIWNKADRNIYTAHEIAQIIPLINKNNTYEKFLFLNRWILSFWPNAVAVPYAISNKPYGSETTKHKPYSIMLSFIEKISYRIQYNYMKSKITREVITKSRAIFHPNDWGKVVLKKLSS